jgi:RNA polymerase sigma-70 factor (ECF subfamily)
MIHPNDRQIIEGFLSGDKDACLWFDAIIRGMIGLKVWNRNLDREDIFQDVRLAVYEELRRGRFTGASRLDRYVRNITSNNCITQVRRQRRKPAMTEVEDAHEVQNPGPNPEDLLIDDERTERIKTIADTLMKYAEPECRDIWRLFFYEGLTQDQIGTRIGVPKGTVKSRLSRCKAKAWTALHKYFPDFDWDVITDLEL